MTPRSRPASPAASPRASSPSSTATGGRRAGGWRRGERFLHLLVLTAALSGAACVYLNTFYNAQQAYEEGLMLRAREGDSLSPASRAAFQRAIDKSAVVLDRHADSGYVDDALFLMGRSFIELRRYGDAASTFRQLVDRFPESEHAPEARLALVRSHRLAGNMIAAQAALGLLTDESGELDPAEVLHERGRIALARGDHAAALEVLRELQRDHAAYAREHGIAVEFADATLAAGQYEAAIAAYEGVEGESAALRFARALAASGRTEEAIAAYDDLVAADLADTVRARVHAERGAIHAAAERWDAAEDDFRRAAELAPGSVVASRATRGRARIEWLVRERREEALEILLDAFLHAPASLPGDSSRVEARAVGRILHYQRIAEGTELVAGLDDAALVRSTALYRLAEEIGEEEGDRAQAAEIFETIVERYPESPWAPRALLASGLLLRESGAAAEGEARLRRLIEWRPDDPAADSARRALGEPLPERPPGFYRDSEELIALASALPAPPDPMLTVADQMDRYAERREPETRTVRGVETPEGEQAPVPVAPTNPQLPPGVTP